MFETTPSGAITVTETGPAELLRLLDEFQSEMTRAGWTAANRQGPGLTRAEILREFERADLTPPEELVTLFQWRNSVIRLPDGPISPVYPGFSPQPLSWCIENYVEELQANSSWWWVRQGWFPLEEGIGYYVDCRSNPEDAPNVLYVDEDNMIEGSRERPPLISLCTVVAGWSALVRSGVYFVKGTKWRVDPALAASVSEPEALAMLR